MRIKWKITKNDLTIERKEEEEGKLRRKIAGKGFKIQNKIMRYSLILLKVKSNFSN